MPCEGTLNPKYQGEFLLDSKHIYISGALRGSNEIARKRYETLASSLQSKGLKTYIPHLETNATSAKDVFDKDMEALVNSRLVVAFLDEASLGVGAEVATALERKIPVLGLVTRGASLSRFLIGMLENSPDGSWMAFDDLEEDEEVVSAVVSFLNSDPSHLAKALRIAKVALRFGEVQRATAHPDGQPETDTTHSMMLALLAAELFEIESANLWTFNRSLLIEFALVHDLVEAICGDTNTAFGLTAEQNADKEQREEAAFQQLKEHLGTDSWICRMIGYYKEQQAPEAQFIRFLDKITPKLTHALNRGLALRQIGMTRDDFIKKTHEQRESLRAEFPEFKATLNLFDAACEEVKKSCFRTTFQEVLEGAKRARKRVEKWPQWKRDL